MIPMASLESRIVAVVELMKSDELNDLPQKRAWVMDAFVASLDGILAWHATKMGKRMWCST